jgi:frataxin-like iron-binding protein CyaY
MKLLPRIKNLTYNSKRHKEYYRKMNQRMKEFESQLEDIGVNIEFEPQEEDINIFDQFEEEETAQKVADDYNSGNFYSWFCAKITVKYRGYDATDYLGCCSYKSEKDFKEGGYYIDMVDTCIQEINRDIEEHNRETVKNWTIRKAKNMVAQYGIVLINKEQLTAATI